MTFDWDKLAKHVKEWKDTFNKVKKIGDNRIVYITKSITCYYKVEPFIHVATQLKKFTVSKTLGDILLTLETIDGEEYTVCVSEAFEAKAFGKIRNIELVLLKILDFFSNEEEKNLEDFASQAL